MLNESCGRQVCMLPEKATEVGIKRPRLPAPILILKEAASAAAFVGFMIVAYPFLLINAVLFGRELKKKGLPL